MSNDTPSVKMQGDWDDMTPDIAYSEEGLLTQPIDPLQLDIEDEELSQIIDDYEDDYDEFYENKYNLVERRKKNEIFVFGRQVMQEEKDKLTKGSESNYMDNVMYEIEGTIKPLGMSRVPDLMATPANDRQDSVLMAQEISKAIDSEVKERDNRFVLGLAFKHLPVYFTSCIKIWWNPEIDDYEFGVVHPDLVKVDWTCPTHNADEMRFVSQKVPLTVNEICLRFPKTKEKFLKRLKEDGLMPGEDPSYALLATTIKITEIWFDEYRPQKDNKVEKVSAVAWKYKNVILHKMKNPNFDYKGEMRYFAYDKPGDEGSKRALNDQELAQILMTGELPDNVQKKQVYHNYFKFPRKPYYFMGYDQWGKQPYDETSRIEQNIQNQRNLDTVGKKVEEVLKSRGHHVLSKGAVTPGELEEIDFDERNLDLSVEVGPNGIKDTYMYIPPEEVSAQEFKELDNIRSRMYAVAHSNAVRGEIEAKAPATSNQIARESDFTAADDLVEDTINPAAQWMGDWAMQMIKLRYTRDHFRWIMGIAGDIVWQKLNRNMIADGMMIQIKASGTDKLRAENNAMDMAKMEMIDPYTFFTDMRLSDPEGRTEKLILAKTDPTAYLQKIIKGLDSSKALAQALMAAELPSPPAQPQQQPPPNPVTMPGGQAPQPQPQIQPAPQNTAQVPAQPPQGAPAGSPRTM